MERPELCSFRTAFTISLISEQVFMDSSKKDSRCRFYRIKIITILKNPDNKKVGVR